MALDVGDRRIGVSLSDPMRIIATPHSYIDKKYSNNVFGDIIDLVDKYNIETIVVGMPITLKGTASIQTENVQQFINDLSNHTLINIETIDERLSSVSAKKELIKQGVKTGHNKGEVDKTAATLILQEYLSSH